MRQRMVSVLYTGRMRPTAIFFDVGNTLLFPNREKMLFALHERGVFPSEELLQETERRTKHEFDSLQEGASAIDLGFWQIYYTYLLQALNLSDETLCADLVSRTRI